MRLVFLLQGLFNLTLLSEPQNNIGFITSAIETNLALITASAPALRPIFKARERGNWFTTRKSVAPSRAVDEESGQKSVAWDSPPIGSGIAGKLGRGGSRGGRRGSTRSARNARTGRGGGKLKPIIRVRTDMAELRSQSPRTSEEQAMTNNGIMRISDIQREIDGIAKEIVVEGYVPRPSTADPSITPRVRQPTESMAFAITTDVARPLTSGSTTGGRRYPERYYSESVYPDLDYDDREIRNYNDDRISRYGDRRFGVVTPKGTTPTSKTWKDAGGRPF